MSLSWKLKSRKLIRKTIVYGKTRRKYVAFIHERNILSLNTPTASLEIEEIKEKRQPRPFHELPITETYVHKQRIGVVGK